MNLTRKEKIVAGVLFVLVLLVGAWLIHRDGVAEGETKHYLKQLAAERQAIKAKTRVDVAKSDSLKQISDRSVVRSASAVSRSDSSRAAAAAARSRSDSADRAARAAQAHVVLRGDTAIAGDTSQILLPEIASMIRITLDAGEQKDTTIAKQAATIVQDSLTIKDQAGTIGDLQATVASKDVVIADHVESEKKADEQIATLEKQKNPRCSMKCGIAIGTAGALTIVTIAVKIIRAVGHK